jgi:hypothetical protein
MSAVSSAAWEAVRAQEYDDDRAESVAAIFIEDAMKAYRIPAIHFEKVEAFADQRWPQVRKKPRK